MARTLNAWLVDLLTWNKACAPTLNLDALLAIMTTAQEREATLVHNLMFL
jgi:hypothetical protein